jgi:senataxin
LTTSLQFIVQGREKDVIIFSCVRASPESGIGFLADIRRMNVGLTRAKYAMFVLGREEALRSNQKWAALVEHARERGAIVDVPNAAFDVLAGTPSSAQPTVPTDPRKRRPERSPPRPPPATPAAPAPPAQELEEGEVVDRDETPAVSHRRGRKKPRPTTFEV